MVEIKRLHPAVALLQILEWQEEQEGRLTVELEGKATPLIQLTHTTTQKLDFQQDSLALSQARLDLLEEQLAVEVEAAAEDTLFGTTVEVLDRTAAVQVVQVEQAK